MLAVLSKRFAEHGLRLHPEKTRLVDFRSPPRRGRSFALLGFTHFWGRSRKGRWIVQRKTAKDRFTRSLREIGQWCRAHRHWPVAAQQAALRRRLQGHYAYYGITGNARARPLSPRSPAPMAQVAASPLVAWTHDAGDVCPSLHALSAPSTGCFSQCLPSHSDALVRRAGCPNRARPDLREPRVSNHPRPPGKCKCQICPHRYTQIDSAD